MRPESPATRHFVDWWKNHKHEREINCVHIVDMWKYANHCIFQRLKCGTQYCNQSFLWVQSQGKLDHSCTAHAMRSVYRWLNAKRKDRKLFDPPKKAEPLSAPPTQKVSAFCTIAGCRPVALRSLDKKAYYGAEHLTLTVLDDKNKQCVPRHVRLPCTCGVGRGFPCFVHRDPAPPVEAFALTTSYAYRRTHVACVIEAMFARPSIFAEELEKRRWTKANEVYRLRVNRQLGWTAGSGTFWEYCSDIKKKGQFGLDPRLVAAIAKLYF